VRRAPRRTLCAESGLAFKIGNRQSAIGKFFASCGQITGFFTVGKTVNFGKETVKFLFPRRRAGFPACRFAGLSSPECPLLTGKSPAPADRINDGGVADCARGGRAPRTPLAPDRGHSLFKIGNRQSAIGNLFASCGQIAGFFTVEKTVNFGKETVKFLLPRRRAGFPACRFAGLSSPECLPTSQSPAPAGRINDGGVAACARGGRAPRTPLAPDRGLPLFKIGNRQSAIGNFFAFSLIELLVVMVILSLIVLALMMVFNTTQRAFRASVTQSDVMEGSRATMDLITTDLRGLTPSDYSTNYATPPVNFFALDNNDKNIYSLPSLAYVPLTQSLPGTSVSRTNLLNYFFMLGRENTKWIGIGYAVNPTNATTLYPLYRFYRDDLGVQNNPLLLYSNFTYIINNGQWTNMSHVMDGVVHLVVRAYDPNGYQMTNTWQYDGSQGVTNFNTQFFPSSGREPGFSFYSNTVPAAVEIQLGVLEDRVLRHAESLPFQSAAQINYLGGQSGAVHLFRQRVAIPNVDPSAY
jgi:type II secretory pathway pseudopilin PulG